VNTPAQIQEAWDRQMEEDAKSGLLDRFYEKLAAENLGQAEVPLDEVLGEEGPET
jgi:hypothetical protein